MSWTPQSLLAAGIGQSAEVFESGVEGGTGEILLTLRKFVEEFPEQIEVGAGGCIDTAVAAESCARVAEISVPAEAVGRLLAQMWHGCECGKNTFERLCETRLRADGAVREAAAGIGCDGTRCFVGAGDGVKFGETEAAPRRTQNTEPGDAVFGIEESAGEGDGIEDFGAVVEVLKFDGAEGNFGFAQSGGDGSERGASATEDGDAVFSRRRAGGFHSSRDGCG